MHTARPHRQNGSTNRQPHTTIMASEYDQSSKKALGSVGSTPEGETGPNEIGYEGASQ
jgi:hypothetical protein